MSAESYTILTARYTGQCSECRAKINTGDEIFWTSKFRHVAKRLLCRVCGRKASNISGTLPINYRGNPAQIAAVLNHLGVTRSEVLKVHTRLKGTPAKPAVGDQKAVKAKPPALAKPGSEAEKIEQKVVKAARFHLKYGKQSAGTAVLCNIFNTIAYSYQELTQDS